MAENSFDVIVIGAGPGGYVAAIRAAQHGLRVACIDAAQLGGVCNNVGCIPTKALLESAADAHRIEHLSDFGITVTGVQRDLLQAARRARAVADQGAKGIAYLLRKHKIELVQGWGRLTSKSSERNVHRVDVTLSGPAAAGNPIVGIPKPTGTAGQLAIEAPHVIIATGSRAKPLPMLKPDGERIWSSNDAVYPSAVPASLAIIGAGAVGAEFADVYSAFGVTVTLIEALDRVLPNEDPEISAVVDRAFRARNIDVLTGARVEAADVGADRVRLTITAGDTSRTLDIERVLVAVGRAPVIDDIGLQAAGVESDRGFITTDTGMRTNVPGIYAIGDVTKPPLLAHKAWAEAAVVVATITGQERFPLDYANIPGVTYCHPEVASVGLTEAAALERGITVTTGKFPWSANGRARAMGATDGFLKVVADRDTGQLIGAHIVGPYASELIGELTLGRLLETTLEELDLAVHPHPTLSDAIPEAALMALGRVIHL